MRPPHRSFLTIGVTMSPSQDDLIRARRERGRAVCSDPTLYPQGASYRYEPERCVRVPPARAASRKSRTEVLENRAKNLRKLTTEAAATRKALFRSVGPTAGPLGDDRRNPYFIVKVYVDRYFAPTAALARRTSADPAKMRAALARHDIAFNLVSPEDADIAALCHEVLLRRVRSVDTLGA
jgi:hypothetical protein